MTDLFVEDGTTISGFAFRCTRAELWAAIEDLMQSAWMHDELGRERAHVRELLGMDDGEGELGPDSTG